MLAKISNVADKAFDYIVIGGGTAGLTVAARLSEDPNVSVAVLEAGQANLDDPKILIPAQFTGTFNDPKYDWAFPTTPHKNSNDRVSHWNRGRGLGGTSGMNFLCWSKPPAGDVNAFGKLGNDGWSWEDYSKYSKLTETFHPASAEHAALYPHTPVLAHLGTSGPVQTSTPHHVHTVDLLFKEACVNKGLKAVEDPYGGDISGVWLASATMDPKTWTRSYAASAYYQPNKDRANLSVLTEAHVSRVLFSGADGEELGKEDITAKGVEFIHAGTTYTVHVKKEVVLSAGSIKSPHILELSGIGRASLLTSLSIPVKIDLPGVGENVQEHTLSSYTLELESNEHNTLDLLRDPVFAKEAIALHASGKGMFRTGITSFAYFSLAAAAPSAAPSIIASLEAEIEKRKAGAPVGLKDQWDVQLQTLRDEGLPDLEIVIIPGYLSASSPAKPERRYLSVELIQQHPFSRGYIHAKSNDPFENPTVEANLFDFDYDLQSMVQLFRFSRSLQEVEPWKSAIRTELDPGLECQTDEQIREFLKNTAGPCWHTIGSCSMMPREKQGVVDSKLKVYGTTNLRVADISIIPLHLAAHTQATAYVIGEKAADFITGKSRV